MLSKRIIPTLCLNNKKLVHRIQFDKKLERYVGDPLNTIHVFNEYNVDEIILLDLEISRKKLNIDFDFLRSISEEAFFPLTYGGGIHNILDAKKIISSGYEKIVINSSYLNDKQILDILVSEIGTQSIIISLNLTKYNDQYYIYNYLKNEKLSITLENYLNELDKEKVGEILINLIDIDGKMTGCDFNLIKKCQNITKLPLIYKGGLCNFDDIKKVLSTNFSAISSSTFFIMKKKNGGIVLDYPSSEQKDSLC